MKISHKNLESIIGRLEWTSYAVPNAKFFLNRIRHLLHHSDKHGWAYIPNTVKEDMLLYLEFIQKATISTSINNLVFRHPSHIYYANSCPFGLRGYSLKGSAWRFYVPPSLRSKHTHNVLEYMAQRIYIWLDAFESNLQPQSCCLWCSNSSSLVGCMFRINFDPIEKLVHEKISWHLTRILQEAQLYSQHQRGKHNLFADILSSWYFSNTTELTIILHTIFPTRLPTDFKISPLPNVINCWIISNLQKLQRQT